VELTEIEAKLGKKIKATNQQAAVKPAEAPAPGGVLV
jgi:hypothetical protein